MNKELVIRILQESYDRQVEAILGGITGGQENEEFANQDLERYATALSWARKHFKIPANKSKKHVSN